MMIVRLNMRVEGLTQMVLDEGRFLGFENNTRFPTMDRLTPSSVFKCRETECSFICRKGDPNMRLAHAIVLQKQASPTFYTCELVLMWIWIIQ